MQVFSHSVQWWADHSPAQAWIEHYQASTMDPHRQTIVEALRAVTWTSLYEIGCHCGPMLSAILRAWPAAKLSGCDVNQGALESARAAGLPVEYGEFPGVTQSRPDQSIDILLSCYTLAYQDPEVLDAALEELVRLARVGVILCEPMAWRADEVGVHRDGAFREYRHDYLARLSRLPACQGWTAVCEVLSYPKNRLSGLIVVTRP